MRVAQGEFGRFFGDYRLRSTTAAFLSEKEDAPMIAMPSEAVTQFADAVVRLAEVLERLGPKEKATEETPHLKEWLTPEEASTILRVHVQTVTAWCREGKLRASKNGGNEINRKGGKWVISRKEIERYLHRHQVIHGEQKGGAE